MFIVPLEGRGRRASVPAHPRASANKKLKDFAEPFVFAVADYLRTNSQQSSKS
jgi:hypothetical protein